jgi:hypothetical protein
LHDITHGNDDRHIHLAEPVICGSGEPVITEAKHPRGVARGRRGRDREVGE